jgi:hypothetical protein
MTLARPMFPRTPQKTTTEQESTRARADYYFDLEQPLRDMAVVTVILTTISQTPIVRPPGIQQADMVDFLIGHLDTMMQDIFGNYRERLKETAVAS